MEILNQLIKTTSKTAKRVGRGIGSGVGGHTTGRGAKGDKVRGKTKLTADGTKIKKGWIQRLPFLRGKNRLRKMETMLVFNLEQLDKWFKDGETVDIKAIAKKISLSSKDLKSAVKILSKGEISKALTLKGLNVSEATRKKIISAGGNIE